MYHLLPTLALYLANHVFIGIARAQLRHQKFRYLMASNFRVSVKRRMFRSGTFAWAVLLTAIEYLLLYEVIFS